MQRDDAIRPSHSPKASTICALLAANYIPGIHISMAALTPSFSFHAPLPSTLKILVFSRLLIQQCVALGSTLITHKHDFPNEEETYLNPQRIAEWAIWYQLCSLASLNCQGMHVWLP